MRATHTSQEVLAIDGGTPVRKTLLPYGRQSIAEDDITPERFRAKGLHGADA